MLPEMSEVREAVEVKKGKYKMDLDGFGVSPIQQIIKADKVLVALAESFLSSDGKWPEKCIPEERVVTPLCEISFNKGRVVGNNNCLDAARIVYVRDMAEKDDEIERTKAEVDNLNEEIRHLKQSAAEARKVTAKKIEKWLVVDMDEKGEIIDIGEINIIATGIADKLGGE